MQSKRFLNATEKLNPEYRIFVKKTLDIIEQIYNLLDQKGWSQKQLALSLNKSESEISKWLSGTHNLTMQTIAKMEAAIAGDIITTPMKASVVKVSKPIVNLSYNEAYEIHGLHGFIEGKVAILSSGIQNHQNPTSTNFRAQWEGIASHFNSKNQAKTNNNKDGEHTSAA